MCEFMINENRQCKLQKNKKYCHIHINKNIASSEDTAYAKHISIKLEKCKSIMINQKKELSNLHLSIERKNKKINNLEYDLNNKDEQIKNLIKEKELLEQILVKKNETLANNSIKIKVLKNNLNQEIINHNESKNNIEKLNERIIRMKDDYNNFQIIKKYEKTKQSYVQKNIDILSVKNNEFHKLRKNRNFIVHEKILV